LDAEAKKYASRLTGKHSLELVELKASKGANALEAEAKLFEARFPKDKFCRILLSEEGKLLATVPLAKKMESLAGKPLVFLIGSAYGLSPALKASADLLLSLSPLTFPHELARLVCAEQIYRCLTVLSGHPYHHV
jgi:23S rRNA (pseudouridine1915-N3)-methyltransferase